MKKIEFLTDKQKKFLPIWRKQWFEIGISTTRENKPKAENCVSFFYSKMGKKNPKFIWVDSPLSANILISIYPEFSKKIKLSSLGDSLGKSLDKSLRESLWDSMWDSLGDSLRDSLRESLGNSLRESLGNSLWDSLDKSLRESLGDSMGDSKIKYTTTWFWGSFDSYWICFYLFSKLIGVKFKKTDYQMLLKYAALAKSSFWFYPFENICVMVRKPKNIKLNENEKKHCDGGPAIEFNDGWKLWALNDVIVSKEISETPASELDPKLILKEKNVEVRRELLRKIGVERFLKHTESKTLDKTKVEIAGRSHEYELLKINLGEGLEPCPALKMEHASLPGVYLVEFVGRECKTVLDAIQFRNGRAEMPVTLT